MKKTALVSIVMMGLCFVCATARAEDDVLKKMRDFKALMDTLPESTSKEDVTEEVLPATPAVIKETPKIEVDADRPQWTAEPEVAEEDRAPEPDLPKDALESDSSPWSPYEEMDEYETDVRETIADTEESAEENLEDMPFATDTMEEDQPAESEGQDMAVEESGYEWEEDIVEMEMEDDTKQAAQEIKSMLETGITAEVTGEDDGIEDELEGIIEEDEPVLDMGPDQVVEEILPQDEDIENAEPEAIDMADDETEWDAGLNIAEGPIVLEEESDVSAATGSLPMDDAVEAREQENTAAAMPGMETDALSDQPTEDNPMNAQELADPEEMDVLQYRQDLSQRLTGDMLDRNTHIDRITSEVDAEIDDIQTDIEMITGARMDDSN